MSEEAKKSFLAPGHVSADPPLLQPKRRPKYRRKKDYAIKTQVGAQVPATPPAEFLGITREECPIDCNPQRCLITLEGVCAHPHKGGLQAKYQLDRHAVQRYARARRVLAMQAAEGKNRDP